LSRESPLSKGVTNADLNRAGNLSSLKEILAKWVIILENVSEQAIRNEVGMVAYPSWKI